MVQNSHSQDRRSEATSVMDELIRHAKEKKVLLEGTVRTLLAIMPLEKTVLEKGKVYYITEPITGADEQREFAPVASQLVEYFGFNNAESDSPGTPAAHLFFSRLLRQKTIFRLSTHHFRQLCDNRKIFIVTGKVVRASPASEAASKAPEPATTLSSASGTGPESNFLPSKEDPGFAAVIQAVNSMTLQYQTENRISFQSVASDILQAQRVFNTLQDINQALGLVQAAFAAFESKVNQWENKFAVFFQQNRPETVGMTLMNNLKAQQNKGRIHLRSAQYQFGKLISNLEQAKVNLEPSSKDKT
jgi:hypothetical protein